VFLGTVVAGAEPGTPLGYLQAAAEASLVGGLADWFAVVALFRHPLGLPIPHTAVVVERKDQFGETLGEFIQTSFLTGDAVTDRVRAAHVSERAARWLSTPVNADRLGGYLADGAVQLADLLKDDQVHDALVGAVRSRVDSIHLAPVAGQALAALVKDGRHEQVVDAALHGLDRYLDEHRDELHHRVSDKAPWWLPGAVEDRIFVRLLDGARQLLEEMAADKDHDLRRLLDERLVDLAEQLQTSPEVQARADQMVRDLLEQPQLRAWVASMWDDAKVTLRTQAADPDSALRTGLARAIAAGGQRLLDEPVLAARLQDAAETGARYVVEHYGNEITELVSTTISRWDSQETAERLELLLGPDLQYIRINGTVVGAIAGLALHALAQLLG
jgi:uncharacterized membrane-anchored protein YjiN (DUF445 family)